jgi:hypothetical protein
MVGLQINSLKIINLKITHEHRAQRNTAWGDYSTEWTLGG